MSWRIGDFYIAPGATVRIGFKWGSLGDDKGAQWVMGHPKRGERPASLATERVIKSSHSTIGVLQINGAAHYSEGPADYWHYAVDVRNESAEGTRFQIEGGGV
jgi:hypothetical protein